MSSSIHDTTATISSSVSSIEISAIKQMAMRSAQTPGAVSLAWGLPSFRTPEHIRAAVIDALDDDADAGKYSLPTGLPELRALVAQTHARRTGQLVDPERNILISAGNMQGVSATLRTLLDPGDEVIVTDPCFASHLQQIRLCGGQPVFWSLDEAKGWSLNVDSLPSLITNRTRALLLVNPCNPTGSIFSEQALRRVGRLAEEHGLYIVIDDPYSQFCYESDGTVFNLAGDPSIADRVIYLYSFSKAHAMSGWRLGYIVLNESLRRQLLKVHDAMLICAPRISQLAAMAALTGDDTHVLEFEHILNRRRTLICERLNAVTHVFDYIPPAGAYYVFPRIRVEHSDSVAFATTLLDNTGVALTPGSAFGPAGEHHVRMAFCVDEDTINRAFDRIERDYGH